MSRAASSPHSFYVGPNYDRAMLVHTAVQTTARYAQLARDPMQTAASPITPLRRASVGVEFQASVKLQTGCRSGTAYRGRLH